MSYASRATILLRPTPKIRSVIIIAVHSTLFHAIILEALNGATSATPFSDWSRPLGSDIPFIERSCGHQS
jgi:hypothetical protein